ncbi:MAG: hypothetical protein MUF25_00535 [Pirellulaceae bacterium]|nr:hypothetical protein [Pirellulaceae bacterium]
MPKIHMTKGLAAWTTAVVGTLGSGAGAYSIVGNPWAADEVAAVAPADASGDLQSQAGKPTQPVPIPDEAGQPQLGSAAGLPDSPAAAGRRPAMFLDPAVAPASHTESAANTAAGRSYGQDPEATRATPDAYQPMPAPAFGQTSSQAGPEPQLPEFQPPTGAGMPSSWAPNAPQDSTPAAGRSAIALAPPAREEPPADPVAGSAGSTLALGGALRQAAQSTLADVESETPSGGSVYANAAAAAQPALTDQAEEPNADTAREADSSAASMPLSLQPRAASEPPLTASAEPDRSPAAFSAGEPPAQPALAPLSAAATAANSAEGDGVPGAEQLDGVQSPALSVEKLAPPEIQVGKEATFQIHVRNVGKVAAHEVTILDRIPKGTQFVNATPPATPTSQGQLMWNAGTLQPGDEVTVSLQLMPLSEGELGSVAQVVFQTQAAVRTLCTKPQLSVTHAGPQKVLIGETVVFDITVSNPGSGIATSVIMEEDVPEGLAHAAGRELEFEIGSLRPNESRQLQLTLKADKPGLVRNEILVRGDANLIAQHAVELEVIAPALEVALQGPKMRYLDRPATYDVVISNPGTAPAREVELVTYLPKGMKFVSADHKGQYEPQNHAVFWSLEELPANQTGGAKLTVLPLETGAQKLKLEGRAELGLKQSFEQVVQVESVAELQFTVVDEADPIEVGAETTYLITLTNSGSSAATNVQLAINLPTELKALGGDGPTRVAVDGDKLLVDPLARIGPGEEAVYRIKVQGGAAGHQRIQVQLVTQEMPVAVNREEVTRVYDDR